MDVEPSELVVRLEMRRYANIAASECYMEHHQLLEKQTGHIFAAAFRLKQRGLQRADEGQKQNMSKSRLSSISIAGESGSRLYLIKSFHLR